MSDEIVQRVDEVFTEEALKEQDGKVVPLRLGTGGPIIGEATMKYDSEKKALTTNLRVDDPKLAELISRGFTPPIVKKSEES